MNLIEDEFTLVKAGRTTKRGPKEEPEALPIVPRITRLMALAIKIEDMVGRGELRDYADVARLGHVTRARLTQIMNLPIWHRTFRARFSSLARGRCCRLSGNCAMSLRASSGASNGGCGSA